MWVIGSKELIRGFVPILLKRSWRVAVTSPRALIVSPDWITESIKKPRSDSVVIGVTHVIKNAGQEMRQCACEANEWVCKKTRVMGS